LPQRIDTRSIVSDAGIRRKHHCSARPQPAHLAAVALALTLELAGPSLADPASPFAAASSTVKTQDTLLNPTPDRLLREMTTDRPDTTESPFTVDAGRVQIETGLFSYARSRPDENGVRNDSFEIATTNIRIGLTNTTEFNVSWQPYGSVRTHDAAGRTVGQSGIGGIDLRAKINLWGNDAFDKPGATALAVLPYVSLPAYRRNGVGPEHVEGGLIVPLAIVLSDQVDLGLNVGAAAVQNENNSGHHAEWTASASLAFAWTETLGTYYEMGTRVGLDDPRGDIAFAGAGATYKLSHDLQLDAGVNFGLTAASDWVNPFIGISSRF